MHNDADELLEQIAGLVQHSYCQPTVLCDVHTPHNTRLYDNVPGELQHRHGSPQLRVFFALGWKASNYCVMKHRMYVLVSQNLLHGTFDLDDCFRFQFRVCC